MATPRHRQPDLTIVIPAYREGRRIGRTLDALAFFLQHDAFFRSKAVEVIVVAADTTDNTHHIVKTKQQEFATLRLLQPGTRVGKGRDVRYGMLQARGRLVLYMDADLATPLHHLERFYRAAEAGADIVAGTRNLHRHHAGLVRRAVSNTGNLLFRLASGIWIEDSQCGFKLFRHEASNTCFSRLKITGWGFDMEVLAIAKANKLQLQCIRLDDWRSVPHGTFADSIVRNSLRNLKDLGHIVGRRFRGAYSEA